jgi:ferric-chelate reductase
MLAERLQKEKLTTPVILSGPYGSSTLSKPGNFLAIGGGTGATMAFPVILQRVQEYGHIGGNVQLVWIIRRAQDLEWMAPELATLKRFIANAGSKFSIRVFITRESSSRTTKEVSSDDEIKGAGATVRTSIAGSNISSLVDAEPGYEVMWLGDRHPDLSEVVKDFVESAPEIGGSVSVVGSGPGGMGTSLRRAVAGVNDGTRVWRGEEKYDVHLHWDDRQD